MPLCRTCGAVVSAHPDPKCEYHRESPFVNSPQLVIKRTEVAPIKRTPPTNKRTETAEERAQDAPRRGRPKKWASDAERMAATRKGKT